MLRLIWIPLRSSSKSWIWLRRLNRISGGTAGLADFIWTEPLELEPCRPTWTWNPWNGFDFALPGSTARGRNISWRLGKGISLWLFRKAPVAKRLEAQIPPWFKNQRAPLQKKAASRAHSSGAKGTKRRRQRHWWLWGACCAWKSPRG